MYNPYHAYTFSNPLLFIVYLSPVFVSFTSMCLAFSFPEQKGQFPLHIPHIFFFKLLVSSLSKLYSFLHLCYSFRCILPCPMYASYCGNKTNVFFSFVFENKITFAKIKRTFYAQNRILNTLRGKRDMIRNFSTMKK